MAETPREGQPGSGPDGGVLLLDRKFDRGTLATMRGELSRCGSASGLAELALANFVLAVNEIMTNAVRYAGGQGQLQLWRHRDELRCHVVDDGHGIPRRYLEQSRRPDPLHIGGHGLWLARHICDSVEIETGRASGTRVVLKYALPPSTRSTDGHL